MEQLTDKQKRFCQEYVIDLNGTQAAIRAGYSRKTANEIAAQNLAKLSVKAEIGKLRAEIAERNNVTVDYLIRGLKSIADDDISKYFEAKVLKRGLRLQLSKSFPIIDKKNIKKLQFNKKGEVTIEMYSRLEAMVQLGRHIGFFNNEQTTEKQIMAILTKAHESQGLTETDLQKIAEMIYNMQKKQS